MNAETLLHYSEQHGILLWAEGDKLKLAAPPGKLNDKARQLLQQNKSELIPLLRKSEGERKASRFLEPFTAMITAAQKGTLPILPESSPFILETGQRMQDLNRVTLAYAEGVHSALTFRTPDTLAAGRYLRVLERCHEHWQPEENATGSELFALAGGEQ